MGFNIVRKIIIPVKKNISGIKTITEVKYVYVI